MTCFTKCLALFWRPMIAVIVPIVLLPVCLLNDSPASKWLYVILIMSIFWITEAIPQAVTSLIPIGMFPLLGVMTTVQICKLYAHETIFTFLGSVIIASSVEKCDLHKRIAFSLLCHVKCFHRRLHFVFMAVTMFLSMWMQNLTVVAMMCPICLTILEQLEIQGTTVLYKPKVTDNPDEALRPTRITMCYFLGITYAATLGGCGSLFGTPTNLAFEGIFETYFSEVMEIDYLRFFLYCFPVMLLNTLLTWLWLQVLFMGLLRPKSADAVALQVTDEEAMAVKENIILNYKKLGELTTAQTQVTVLLVVLQLALILRSPFYMRKWEGLSKLKITDATPTVIFVILLFVLPSKWNCFKFGRKATDDNSRDDSEALLTWTYVRRKIPWGIVFLLGAGIAIAESGKKFVTDETFGKYIQDIQDIPPLGMLFIVCLVCQIFTEFLSNVAAANIILPILAELCRKSKELNALYLMLPAALSISMAFHSSIGTPGNAFVAGSINVRKKDLFYCGIGPSIITLLTYWSTFPTYGTFIYAELNNATAWSSAELNNATVSSSQ